MATFYHFHFRGGCLPQNLPGLLLTTLLTLVGAASAQTFRALDGAVAWPDNNHPNWVYGSTPTLGGGFTAFLSAHSRTGYYTMNAYQFSLGTYPANYPIIAFNATTNDYTYNSGQFVVPGEVVDLVPGNSGTYAIARFLVPAAGYYVVRGKFLGLEGAYDSVPATRTDVHVLRNSESLFDEMVIGQFTEKSFDFTLNLNQGDTLDFAVGYGSGYKGNQDDSTGLYATITQLPVLTVTPGNPLTLSWPTNLTGFQLLSRANLAPSDAWTPYPRTPAVSGTNFVITNAGSDPQRFFRLKSGN